MKKSLNYVTNPLRVKVKFKYENILSILMTIIMSFSVFYVLFKLFFK